MGRPTVLRTTLFAAALTLVGAGAGYAFDATLDVSGDETLRDRLRAASSVLEAAENDVTAPEEIIAAVQSDYRSLIGALYGQGYYGPSISIRVDGREGADMSLISLPDRVSRVTIQITPGKQFRFSQARVTPLAPGTELPEEFKRGEIARSGLIGDAKDIAVDAWRDASHAKAALASQSITANHGDASLDVALAIDPGPAATFGRLTFSGKTSVSEARLQRIANFPAGGAYDPDALDLVTKRLQRTGTYRSISLREAATLNADNSLDVAITLAEEKPRRFGFGAELSSMEGGTLSAYWMHRNLTDNADRLRVEGEIAGLGSDTGVDYSLGATYRRPATVSRKTTLVLGTEIEHLDEPDYISDSGEFTIGADVETSPNSTFSFALGYRYSEVEDALGDRSFSYIIFPMQGTRDTRDNALNAKSGTYVEAEITPFLGVNGSASGVRLFADGRTYLSFGGDDRFTLATRLQLGSVAGADFTDVPPDYLFYSGGGGTVRGQPYQSLDVDLGGGNATGGASFVGWSTELRALVKGAISVVGFYDVGGIGTTALPGEGAHWHSGAGLGVRYDTGFGPIRFDLAGPVTGDTGDGLQIYIGIGQAF